jgi:hypothetical protein
MRGFEIFEKLPRRPNHPLFRVFEALTDALLRVGGRGNIEQALIRRGVLHDSRGLALYRQHWVALLNQARPHPPQGHIGR